MQLAVYYVKVPQETAHFTRDAAALQEIACLAVEHEEIVQSLLVTP